MDRADDDKVGEIVMNLDPDRFAGLGEIGKMVGGNGLRRRVGQRREQPVFEQPGNEAFELGHAYRCATGRFANQGLGGNT